jgi:hypothetical protein
MATTYGSGLGAKMVGQSRNIPLVGKVSQEFEPPPQFGTPEDPMRDAPIIKITVPVQMGIWYKYVGG